MKQILHLLLCVVLACPAAAQGARGGDVDALRSCVEQYSRGSPLGRTLGACVGIIGAKCGGGTTIQITDCIMREHAAWDHLLNEWWKPMRARAKGDGSWDRLLASQRRWIRDRDAQCQAAYDSAGGGSIRVIYGAECQRDLTAGKAVEFYYSLYR